MFRSNRAVASASIPVLRRDSKPWELSLLSEDRLSRRTIWSSAGNPNAEAFPSMQVLSSLISDTVTDFTLSDLAAQVVRQAPQNAIPTLLGCLTCCYWRSNNKMDISRVANCHSKRSVCGRVFAKGDLVWTCRECSKDPTCVQCDACFKKSNHVGHEVYFHRSVGGSGTCDCGDVEAWAVAGNCSEHNSACQDDHVDPSSSLPDALVRGLQAVLRGVLSVQVSYCTAFVRSFEPLDQNEFLRRPALAEAMEEICMTLHNDDVHTYDQVIQALMSCGFSSPSAQQLTQSVDRDGFAMILIDSFPSTRFEEWDRKLVQEARLLASYQPVRLCWLRGAMGASLQWMIQAGEMHEGLRRVVSRELLRDMRAHAGDYPWSVWGEACPPRDHAHAPGKGLWEAREQFPSEVTALSALETLRLPLSASMLAAPAPPCPASLSVATPEEVFKHRARYPFHACPFTPLAVWTLSSAFLPPTLVDALEALTVRFQHDMIFKLGYSQTFSLLYVAVTLLYVRYLGCAEHSLLSCSVQFYTNNSIAQMLSPLCATVCTPRGAAAGDGPPAPLPLSTPNSAYYRLFPEPEGELQVCAMLWTCLYAALRDQGAKSPLENMRRQDATLVSSHAIRTKRLMGIIRDVEYLCGTAAHCLEILSGGREPGLLALWCDVCTLLQGLCPVRRQTQAHVEHDDDTWMYAADLMITLDHCLLHVLSRALYSCALAPRPVGDPLIARGGNNSSPERYSSHAREDGGESGEGGEYCAPAHVRQVRQEAAGRCVAAVVAAVQVWYEALTRQAPRTTVCVQGVSLDCVAWAVLTDACSVHHPLHHLLAHTVQSACHGGLALAPLFSATTPWQAIADPALRALALHTSVQAGLWKRNGSAVANLLFNYARPQLCRTFRDVDLCLVQTALVFGPTEEVLLLLFLRLEALACFGESEADDETGTGTGTGGLSNANNNNSSGGSTSCAGRSATVLGERARRPPGVAGLSGPEAREVNDALAQRCLRVLLQLFCYPPVVLDSAPPLRPSSGDTPEEVPIEGVHQAVAREVAHCVASGRTALSDVDAVKGLVGSPHTVGDALLDRVLRHVCDRPGGTSSEVPLALRDGGYALCTPHHPSLSLSQQEALLDRLRDRVKDPAQGRALPTQRVRVSRAYRPLFAAEALPVPHPDYSRLRDCAFHPLVLRWLRGCALRTAKLDVWCDLVHMLTLHVHLLRAPGAWGRSDALRAQALHRLVPLVRAVGGAWRAGRFDSDALYAEAVRFVCAGLWALARGLAAHLPGDLADALRPVVDEEDDDRLDDGPRAPGGASRAEEVLRDARERAARAFAALAAEMSDSDSDGDGDGGEGACSPGGVPPRGALPDKREDGHDGDDRDDDDDDGRVVCIVCREASGPLLALACCLPTASLHSVVMPPGEGAAGPGTGTGEGEGEGEGEEEVFRVVGLAGCAVYAQQSVRSPVVHRARQGDHLLCRHTSNTPWREVLAPVPGYALCYSTSSAVPGKLAILLHPVRDLQFLRNGRLRLHATSCGHAMHAACYDHYFAREVAENTHAMVCDVNAQECVCPLCKSLVNMLVPLASKWTPSTPSMPRVAAPTSTSTSVSVSASVATSSSTSVSVPSSSSTSVSVPTSSSTSTCPLPAAGAVEALAEAAVRAEVLRWAAEAIQSSPGGPSPAERTRFIEEARGVLDSLLFLRADEEVHRVFSEYAHLLTSPGVRSGLQVHTLCSVLSTTVCTASHRLLRAGAGPSPATWRLIRALRQVAAHTPLWMHTFPPPASGGLGGQSGWLALAAQLLALFLPAPDPAPSSPVSVPDPGDLPRWERRLANGPWHPVMVQETTFPVHKLVCKLLAEAQAACALPPRWGWLDGPLLAMDLWPLAVLCALPALSPGPARTPLLHYLVLAKVVQVLLDARATGRLPLPRAEGSGGPVPAGAVLQAARCAVRVREVAAECAGVGVRVGGGGPVTGGGGPPTRSPAVCGEEACAVRLLAYLVDCLVPFVHMLHLLCTDQPSAALPGHHTLLQSLDGQMRYLHTAWAALGVPFASLADLLAYLADGPGTALVERWAGAYRRHFLPGATRRGDMSPAAAYPLAPAPLRRRRKSAEAELEGTHSEGLGGGAQSEGLEEGGAQFEGLVEGAQFEGLGEGAHFEGLEEEAHFEGLEEGAQSEGQSGAEDGWSDVDVDMDVEMVVDNGADEELHDFAALTMRRLLADMTALTSPDPAAATTSSEAPPPLPPPVWQQRGLLPSHPLVDEAPGEASAWTAHGICLHDVPPLQGSLPAALPVFGLDGTPAALCYADRSHFPVTLSAVRRGALVGLPRAFTDWYQRIQGLLRAGRHGEHGEGDAGEDGTPAEDAVLCLVCGDVLVAGRRARPGREGVRNPGEATAHARRCGGGVGVFLLLGTGQVLLTRGGRAIYATAHVLYADDKGAGPRGRGGNQRPLHLDDARYAALREMYWDGEIAREVTRKRATADTLIRQNWF